MNWIFYGAYAFNAYLSKGASAFNVDPSEWDLSKVTSMCGRFGGASAFVVDFSNWEVSKFISDLSQRDVSRFTDTSTGQMLTAHPCLFRIFDRPGLDQNDGLRIPRAGYEWLGTVVQTSANWTLLGPQASLR